MVAATVAPNSHVWEPDGAPLTVSSLSKAISSRTKRISRTRSIGTRVNASIFDHAYRARLQPRRQGSLCFDEPTIHSPPGKTSRITCRRRTPAKIVGENTGGGAHGIRPYRLSAHFTASIPFSYSRNPVTDSDWEGVGIKPDVSVPADQALLRALSQKRNRNWLR